MNLMITLFYDILQSHFFLFPKGMKIFNGPELLKLSALNK